MEQEKRIPLSERVKDPALPVIHASQSKQQPQQTQAAMPPDGTQLLSQAQKLEQI